MTSLYNSNIDVWDCRSGKLLYSLPGWGGSSFCYAWSPDSWHLAACGSSENILIWNLEEIERVLTDLKLWPPENIE